MAQARLILSQSFLSINLTPLVWQGVPFSGRFPVGESVVKILSNRPAHLGYFDAIVVELIQECVASWCPPFRCEPFIPIMG